MASPTIFNGRRTKLLTADGALLSNGSKLDFDGAVNYIANNHSEAGVTGWATYAESQTFTVTIASPAVFTVTNAHNYAVGQPVVFSTSGALPTGLTAGTTYYVSNVPSTTTFRVSASLGGADVNTSGSQSGTHTLRNIQPTRGASYSGSSPTLTWTSTGSTPLRGSTSFLATKDAANRAGEGVAYDFTIDRADSTGGIGPAVQQITFDYEIASGTYGYGTSTTLSDLTLWIIADPSGTPSLIQPAGYKIDGGRVRATFQPNKTSTSYRLIVHVSTTSASAWTVEFDNFSVGPQVRSYGPAMSDWQAYTPTFTGFGTVSTQTFWWRRAGDSVEIKGRFTAGTTTGTEARISLPSGLTSDSQKINGSLELAGKIDVNRAGSTFFSSGTVLIEPSVAYLTFGLETSTTNGLTKQFGSTVLATGEIGSLYARVPIVGWSSNTLVSDSADTRVVAARYSTAAAQSVANGATDIINFGTVSYDTHGAVTTGASWKFTCKVPGKYKVIANFIAGGTGTTGYLTAQLFKNGSIYSKGRPEVPINASGQGVFIADEIDLVAGDYIDVRLNNPTGSARALSSTASENYITVEMLSGPSQIAASEVVAMYANGVGSGTLNSSLNIVKYPTVVADSHGGYSASTGKYTIPAAGWYSVSAGLRISSGLTSGQNAAEIALAVNGSTLIASAVARAQASLTAAFPVSVSVPAYYFTGGQTIEVQSACAGTTPSYADADTAFFFSVARVGGVM